MINNGRTVVDQLLGGEAGPFGVGYLQEQGSYKVLNLPAIAPEDAYFELGHGFMHHRRDGEVLHPRHEPRTVLDEIKREMGPLSFSAQWTGI